MECMSQAEENMELNAKRKLKKVVSRNSGIRFALWGRNMDTQQNDEEKIKWMSHKNAQDGTQKCGRILFVRYSTIC